MPAAATESRASCVVSARLFFLDATSPSARAACAARGRAPVSQASSVFSASSDAQRPSARAIANSGSSDDFSGAGALAARVAKAFTISSACGLSLRQT
jgi:hypothetical protein